MNVFPIKAGAKFPPLVKGWQQAAKPLERWAASWANDKNCNWGVHCEGMIVVDVDPKNGGEEQIAALEMIYGFPQTRTVRTPSGGAHLYYLLPEGHPGVTNRPLAPGIDIKSTGGYVLAAGSRTEAGNYIAGPLPIAPAPEWLVERCGISAQKADKTKVDVPDAPDKVIHRALDWLEQRPKGDEAYATACGLRDFGLSQEQALQLLWWHDGRSEGLIRSKIQHAYKYARGEPGGAVALDSDFSVIEPTPVPKPKHGPLLVQDMAQGVASRRPYLVKGMLQKGVYGLLYGAPGEGKTFVALDIAYHVAAGLEWMGCKVRQGLVLYLAYEGQGGLSARAAALVASHPAQASVPLYIQPAGYRFHESTDCQQLGQTIADLPEKPVLIVIDTLARAAIGWDENSASDMSAFNRVIANLIETTGATVLVVHHSGKNEANGARGSSALLGAIDTEIQIANKEIRSTKQRDMEELPPINFKLAHWVDAFAKDEDGEDITSCTVEPDRARSSAVWVEAFTLGVLSKRIAYADLRNALKENTKWGKSKIAEEINKEPKLAHDSKEVWYVAPSVDSP